MRKLSLLVLLITAAQPSHAMLHLPRGIRGCVVGTTPSREISVAVCLHAVSLVGMAGSFLWYDSIIRKGDIKIERLENKKKELESALRVETEWCKTANDSLLKLMREKKERQQGCIVDSTAKTDK